MTSSMPNSCPFESEGQNHQYTDDLAPGRYGGQLNDGEEAPPPYPSSGAGQWHPAYGYSEPRTNERNWALAAHLGSFAAAWLALGLLAPLVVLIFKGGTSPFIRRHAVESLNFQINALFWTIVFAVSIFLLIGLVLLPLYGLFYLVAVVSASRRASQGQDFRYPLTLRFVS